jgi:hypothetical protein
VVYQIVPDYLSGHNNEGAGSVEFGRTNVLGGVVVEDFALPSYFVEGAQAGLRTPLFGVKLGLLTEEDLVAGQAIADEIEIGILPSSPP